jgi:hypothetical protein
LAYTDKKSHETGVRFAPKSGLSAKCQ